MGTVTTIGIDLAKQSFQVHGVDELGKVVLRKSLRRDKVSAFFSNLPPCLVGMEACAGSAHWERVIAGHGHEVRRMHARFVTPYRMADKSDSSDAAAICEAVQRPRMRFVPGKSREQADIQSVHRVRSGLVRARTAAINQIRGLLGECGIVVRQGAGNLRSSLPSLIADLGNGLGGTMRRMLVLLYEHIASLDAQIASLNDGAARGGQGARGLPTAAKRCREWGCWARPSCWRWPARPRNSRTAGNSPRIWAWSPGSTPPAANTGFWASPSEATATCGRC